MLAAAAGSSRRIHNLEDDLSYGLSPNRDGTHNWRKRFVEAALPPLFRDSDWRVSAGAKQLATAMLHPRDR
ncbi:MAG TPA: hypothetical protein VKT77_08045 [Chthonomonadaceae bacterium]|nr:hypothetical protein [Chthonomonadaceae bacterium]